MKNNKSLLMLTAVFVILLGGAYFLYGKLSGTVKNDILSEQNMTEMPGMEEESSAAERMAAPDFTVTDSAGNAVSLADLAGKPVVLNFWASWCGPCKSEMPEFDAAYKEYGEEIHFVMVNLTDGSRETIDSAAEYIEEQGYSFPVYFDTESSAAIAYGVLSIPVTYFIDAEGYGVAQARGALDGETLRMGIEMITGE